MTSVNHRNDNLCKKKHEPKWFCLQTKLVLVKMEVKQCKYKDSEILVLMKLVDKNKHINEDSKRDAILWNALSLDIRFLYKVYIIPSVKMVHLVSKVPSRRRGL